MQKIYLLLRNNVKSGPFTIGELFQQQLKPSDLIWVEGKSIAWAPPADFDLTYHPHESEEVKNVELPPVAAAPKLEDIRVGNLIPEKDLEKRAEAIRRRALATVQQPNYHKSHSASATPYTPKTIYQDDSKIHLTHRKPQKGFDASTIASAALVAMIIGFGWYNGWSPINQQKNTNNSIAIPGMQEMKTHATTKAAEKIELTTEQASAAMAIAPTDTVIAKPVAKQWKAKEPAITVAKTPVKKEEPIVISEPKSETTAVAVNTTPVQKQEEKQQQTTVVAVPKQEVVEEGDKKKKLGQVFAGLFKKKKKNDVRSSGQDTTAEDN